MDSASRSKWWALDHDTICTFRRNNKVLALASELGYLKKVGGISVDGTKIKANASKHAAVSYQRAETMIQQLEFEVDELMKKAENADSVPLARIFHESGVL